MKIAILSPVAWRTPPRHYGPWEQMAANLTEGLVKAGFEVTLFATGDSQTTATLDSVIKMGYEEDRTQDAKVVECLHISNLMEKAHQFDLVHNHYDFLPLTYTKLISTPVVTTIHGFSSERIVSVYEKYNNHCYYVAISDANKHAKLRYSGTIYNGLDTNNFTFNAQPQDYLLFFGRIHPDKGTATAIRIAKRSGKRLIIAGIIQDEGYFKNEIEHQLDDTITFIGSAGPAERDELLGKATALLHPINFEEPFGLSVAEAMLCGTPVIAYRKGAMPELIADGETGFLVDNEDEAVIAVEKVATIDRSACRARGIAKFSSEKMVEDYITLYQKILNTKK